MIEVLKCITFSIPFDILFRGFLCHMHSERDINNENESPLMQDNSNYYSKACIWKVERNKKTL